MPFDYGEEKMYVIDGREYANCGHCVRPSTGDCLIFMLFVDPILHAIVQPSETPGEALQEAIEHRDKEEDEMTMYALGGVVSFLDAAIQKESLEPNESWDMAFESVFNDG
jgi:hypothetical protein